MFSRAVVTGSEGFIGGHLVDRLLDMKISVLGIDDMTSGLKSTYNSHIKSDNYIGKQISINDNRISQIFKDFRPDVVFHLAAKSGVTRSVLNPTFSDLTNINGSVNLLEASRSSGVKRFIFSSSSSVYGGASEFPTKELSDLNPKSPYALQKLCVEKYCKLFFNEYGLESLSLRYFNVFGPRQRSDLQYSAVIAAFVNSIKTGKSPAIYGSGEQFRDFTYVGNVVDANLLAASSVGTLRGQAVNIGCGHKTSINELCRIICDKPAEYFDARPGDVFGSLADISRANSLIGYNPRVSLSDGIEKTIDWYLSST
tara:strand:- start:15 stop:950 length:936 start_codon:yes stop_codon:yes gene_type:complete